MNIFILIPKKYVPVKTLLFIIKIYKKNLLLFFLVNLKLGLNIFLIPINISHFSFSPFKIFF